MAIDLPPALPPQLATASYYYANYKRDDSVVTGDIKGTTVRIVGNHYLSAEKLQALMAQASLPSEFIKELTRSYYDAGHLLMKVRYFREGPVVTVMVGEYELAEVRADDAIRPYFTDLVGDKNLSMPEYHRLRALARIQAQREGVDYTVSFEVINDNQAVLVLTGNPLNEHDATDYIVEFNNRGSRFAGRYYGVAGVKHHFNSGTEASLVYQHAFTDWGEAGDGKNLDQFKLGVNHPFTFGLYGLELSHAEYDKVESRAQFRSGACTLLILTCTPASTTIKSVESSAEIFQFSITGKQYLYSTPVQQITLSERLEHVDSIVEENGLSKPSLDEQYQTAELGVDYSRQPLDSGTVLKLGLDLRVGLGGDGGTLDSYDDFQRSYSSQNPSAGVSPEVVPAARSGEFYVLKPRAEYHMLFSDKYVLGFSARAQIADEQLPQQQQYVLGGMKSMSAYLPGVLVGDQGYHLKAEVTTKRNWWGFIWKPAAFIEYGATSFKDASGDLGEEQRLSDMGLKLSTDFGDALEMEIVAAVPLSDDVSDVFAVEKAEADFFWRLRKVF